MRAYVIRRLFLIVPTLLILSIIVFIMIRFIPGSILDLMAQQMAGQQGQAGGSTVQAGGSARVAEMTADYLRKRLGLDVPIHVQYGRWLGVLPKNEWGFRAESSVSNLSVTRDEAVTVSAEASNVGDTTSDYQVILKLDGATLETKSITLLSGASQVVRFTTSSSTQGTYSISADPFTRFSGVLQGSLGEGLWKGNDVLDEIVARLPVSVELGIMAIVIAVVLAIPIGVLSAIRQDTVLDFLGRSLAIGAMSIPSFWIGTMVILMPSLWWGWMPEIEYTPLIEDPAANLGQFWLPALILGAAMSGTTMRIMRTMMLEVLRQDYIRTAWAKGLKERAVIVVHALKNALIPVITIIGMSVPLLIGGSVIIEQIFALPGVGQLFLNALNTRDYPMISGVNVTIAAAVVGMNLVVDLAYGLLDPRIRYR